jgi:hypothetical protein
VLTWWPSLLFVTVMIGSLAASAAQTLPDAKTLAEAVAKRYPQPIRVAAIIDRTVLWPVASRSVAGRVRGVACQADGTIVAIVDYGGVLGFFTHPIAIPINGMALLGQYMEIMSFTPEQVKHFATFDAGSATALHPDRVINVALASPAH